MIDVDVSVAEDCDETPPALDHAAIVAAVLDAADVAHDDTEVSLALRLVGRDTSAALNGDYRDKPYATNVLSFPADLSLPGFRALGDLAVCLPVVVDEARAQDKAVTDHYTHMIVHGVFHLLGHDHIDDDEAEIMEAAERRVLAGLGISDPYRVADTHIAPD